MDPKIPYGSEAYRKLNPHLFPVARLRAEKPEQDQRNRGEDSGMEESKASTRYRISIAVFRKRLLDSHDNARSACKPLVDSITRSLGFKSDDCQELEWEYHQLKTEYATGTHIIISRTSPVRTKPNAT